MKIFLIALVIAIAIFAGFGYFPEKGTVAEDYLKSNEKENVMIEEKTEAIFVETKVVSIPPKRTEAKKEIYVIAEKEVFDDAFEIVEMDDIRESFQPKKNVEPITAFKMKPNTIKNLRPGDKIKLPEINDVVYELNIETAKVNNNKSITLEASIEGEDKKYFSILTEGEHFSFLTVKSPDGVFEIEIFNGNGYVYSSTEISNTYIDYSKTDSMIPPQDIAH